jgi:hypothetical protein
MDEARERKLALNEAIAREVNEHVESVAAQWHDSDETIELICECSLDSCSQRVHVALRDYHAVRQSPARFLLVDEHVNEEIEHRVGAAGNATVVEKDGPGHQVAAELA